MIRGIKLFYILFLLIFGPLKLFAFDEYWGIYQFKKGIGSNHFILVEYVERDRTQFFENKNLGLTRLSIGGNIGTFKYLVGGGYVDFTETPDERRLHQFILYNIFYPEYVVFPIRFGIEERSFIGDNQLYLRGRFRVQANILPQYKFGLSVYNEAFYVPNGFNKFSNGFNENRFGLGLRYLLNDFEFYLYKTEADVKTPSKFNHFNWLQLQTVISF